jgi:lipoate-protein ligase A
MIADVRSSPTILRDDAAGGEVNMGRDIELFASAETGCSFVRFYSWDGPWITLGRFQTAAELSNPDLVPWIVRPTGGKAVLHGHDLTVTIAVPFASTSVRAVYRSVIAPIVAGLQRAGQPAKLGEDTRFASRGRIGADCFRHIGPNDVVDPNTGRKLVGCALKVSRRAAIAQCSIPIALPLVDPAMLYKDAHVALPISVDREELIQAISAELSS